MPTAAKIIVDTSVWIDFFRGKLTQSFYENLSEGMRLGLIVITDIIRHEILVGAINQEHYKILSRLLETLDCLRIAPEKETDLDLFAWELKQKGLKGSYTDVSIAFLCTHYKLPILTFDNFFHVLDRKGLLRALRSLD